MKNKFERQARGKADAPANDVGALKFSDIQRLSMSAVGRQRLKRLFDAISEANEALREENERLAEAATKDPLTGLPNRRAYDEFLEREVALRKATASQQRHPEPGPLSIAYGDLTKFRDINNTYGHDAGDIALKCFATILNESVRKTDMAARLGGDEFMLVLPNCSAEDAQIIVNKINNRLKGFTFEHQGRTISIATNMGTATYQPDEDIAAFVARADGKMYEDKKSDPRRKASGPEASQP